MVNRQTGILQGFGLRNGAWKTVEQAAIGAIGLRQAILDQTNDQVIPAFTAARSMSPVEICGMSNFLVMNVA
jgi:hypothetical protein